MPKSEDFVFEGATTEKLARAMARPALLKRSQKAQKAQKGQKKAQPKKG